MSKESFPNKEGALFILDLIKVIHENRNYLSEIDGAIGDGDHGINMDKGFRMAGREIDPEVDDMSSALGKLGRTLLMKIGGSMGPIYGTFFKKMAKTCKDHDYIDKYIFRDTLYAGYKGIVELENAKVGDKTIIDTLDPAVQAFSRAVENGVNFGGALTQMIDAAEKGKDSTQNLAAKVGRAARLGERSRGVLDAGASSCFLILQSLATSIMRKI